MPNYYKEALEALGKTGSKVTIRNQLNAVATKSDDEKLRKLAAEVIRQFDYSSLYTDHTSLKDSNAVETTEIVGYCESNAYK